MTRLAVRALDAERDEFDAMAALWTRCKPDIPRAGSIWRRRHAEATAAGTPGGIFLALVGDDLVGVGTYDDCPVAGEPGQLQVSFAVPAGEHAGDVLAALDAVIREAILPLDPPVLVAYANDTDARMVAFFESGGYEVAQRTASSLYAPTGGEAEVLRASASALAARGYETLTGTQLAAVDPEWKRRYYALEIELIADIPFLGPVREKPYETFEQRFADPARWNPEATFLARERATGDLVGESLLLTFSEIPGYSFAGMTGVVRSHRRRGIARACKLATLAYAQQHGIDRIVALNEENNPMLALNLDLGFELQHMQLTMQKRLRA